MSGPKLSSWMISADPSGSGFDVHLQCPRILCKTRSPMSVSKHQEDARENM